MEPFNKEDHWERIYQTKALEEVSWYQKKPSTSLAFVQQFKLKKTDKIIDIGGGDSFFVDHLLAQGFEDITVLDISPSAIERAQKRLGKKANQVKWIIADASTFESPEKYDFWHDRAAFHFLTAEVDIQNYISKIQTYLKLNGMLVIGTFAEEGPKKCSGIDIQQYSETTLGERLKEYFKKINCIHIDHTTPSNKIQKFIFCSFQKLNRN